MADTFTVDLAAYAGPLDLLLYLVRREELDLIDVSLAKVTEQYFGFLEIIEAIDVDSVADFLEPAGLLIEMKSRQVIPSNPLDAQPDLDESILDDPADQLVHRLIQYKRFRDVASILDEQSRRWQLHYPRQSRDVIVQTQNESDQPIASVEIWDIVSAFGRILRERQPAPTAQVIYDETPIHVYMNRIHEIVKSSRRIELQSLFEPGQHKSAMVGMFLATLELTRHHGLKAEQIGYDGPMYLTPGPDFVPDLKIAEIDNISEERFRNSNMPVRPR